MLKIKKSLLAMKGIVTVKHFCFGSCRSFKQQFFPPSVHHIQYHTHPVFVKEEPPEVVRENVYFTIISFPCLSELAFLFPDSPEGFSGQRNSLRLQPQ